MTRELPAPELLRKILRYDAQDGKLYWRERPDVTEYWNEKYAGCEALSAMDSRGYRKGKVLGKNVLAHRVIWAICTGKWPQYEIDHKDGDPKNNKLSNLREANRNENMHNRAITSRNKSGYKGVSWNKARKKWSAQIRTKGEKTCLGMFDTAEDAHIAYCAAVKEEHKDFANPGHPFRG